MTNTTCNAVKVTNLTKVYTSKHSTKTALNSVNLNIPNGSFYAILGPNGAGKSTFINILSSCINKTSGEVTILGNDLDINRDAIKKKIGVVPQDINLDPFFTVREYLEFYSGFFGIKNNSKKISEILDVMELSPHEKKTSRMLSGGMKRRLLMAKALVNDPEIIILDEPTAGVDIDLRFRLWEYMKKLNNLGKTIILTTHYLEEVDKLCDHVCIINNGEVMFSGKKENVKKLYSNKTIIIKTDCKNLDILSSFSNFIENFDNTNYSDGISIKMLYSSGNIDVATIIQIENILKQHNCKIVDIFVTEPSMEDVFRHFVLGASSGINKFPS